MATVIPDRRKNQRVAAAVAFVFVGMVGLAYASVPLYRAFCQATGFGGTTQRANAAPEATTDKIIKVRFDANTAGSLGWNFHADQTVMPIKVGEQNMAHYSARNLTDKTVTGTAVFNVTPAELGAYFNKIQCFCFTEQTLKPGESVDLPVVFFVDPAMLDDPDAKSVSEITLSYTFFPSDKPQSVSQVNAPAKLSTN